MDEFWREPERSAAQPEEVVLTYHQPDAAAPVTLRYEHPLPDCMRPRPEAPASDLFAPAYMQSGTNNPLNPPERPKARWGVRIYVVLSLLVILACLGTGIWYVSQYGWTLPGNSSSGNRHDYQEELPPWDGFYRWEAEDQEDQTITIPSYPTGGDTRLALSSAEGLPALSLKEVYDQVTPSVVAGLAEVVRQRRHRRDLF